MREVSGDLDLAEKPLGSEDGGQLGPQDLDRDLATVFQILGEVDRGHAASAEFVLDGVVVREGGFQSFDGVRHRSAGTASIKSVSALSSAWAPKLLPL